MILTPLLPHQQEVAARIESLSCAALFLDLGLGKSLLALDWAVKKQPRLILITSDKANTMETWPDQVARHTTLDCVVRPEKSKDFERIRSHPGPEPLCVAVSYDFLSNRLGQFRDLPFTVWIGDESGDLKDQRTRRFKNIQFLTSRIPNRIILNGKAITERLEDIWAQVFLLDQGQRLGHTLTRFRSAYMQPDPQGYGWVPQTSAFTRVRGRVSDIAIWMESDGRVRMPSVHRHVVHLKPTPEQAELDRQLREEFAARHTSGRKIETNYAVVVYHKRIQLLGGVFRSTDEDGGWDRVPTQRLDVVRELVRQNPGEHIVIWYQYQPELTLLKETLAGNNVFVYEPGTNVLDAFSKYKGGGVLLISNHYCKGLNQLADAGIALFYSNPFSYRMRAQAEGRTRRISSTREDTHIVDIVTEGGVDQAVYHLLSQKHDVSLTLLMVEENIGH